MSHSSSSILTPQATVRVAGLARHRTRTQELCGQLTELAYELGASAQLPVMAELCVRFKTSPNTLSDALKELEARGVLQRVRSVGVFVSDDLKPKVKELALVCRPSFFRAANHSPVWDVLVETISERAARHDVIISPYFSGGEGDDPPFPAALVRHLESGEVAGVLGIGLWDRAATWLMERGVPIVNLFGKGHVIILGDHAQTARMGAQALLERGCRNVGLWALDVEGIDSLAPRQSFQSALESAGARFSPHLVEVAQSWSEKSGSITPAEQGHAFASRIFEQPRAQWPDGLVINDDTMTHGALIALRQMGVAVGKDVQIATHSNKGSSLLLGEDALILLEFDTAEIVETMFERMEQLWSGPTPGVETTRGEDGHQYSADGRIIWPGSWIDDELVLVTPQLKNGHNSTGELAL